MKYKQRDTHDHIKTNCPVFNCPSAKCCQTKDNSTTVDGDLCLLHQPLNDCSTVNAKYQARKEEDIDIDTDQGIIEVDTCNNMDKAKELNISGLHGSCMVVLNGVAPIQINRGYEG